MSEEYYHLNTCGFMEMGDIIISETHIGAVIDGIGV